MKKETNSSTPIFYSPPKIVWKLFQTDPPSLKQWGFYLLWNAHTGKGTTRTLNIRSNQTTLRSWTETYTHWAFYQKGTSKEFYGR